MRSSGGAPGPSGAGPRIKASCSRLSSSPRIVPTRLDLSPNARKIVPLPTPASAAIRSIETCWGPRSANRRRAVQSTRSWLRCASARRRGAWPATGRSASGASIPSSIGAGSWCVSTLHRVASGPRSGWVLQYLSARNGLRSETRSSGGNTRHERHRRCCHHHPRRHLQGRRRPLRRDLRGQAHGRLDLPRPLRGLHRRARRRRRRQRHPQRHRQGRHDRRQGREPGRAPQVARVLRLRAPTPRSASSR